MPHKEKRKEAVSPRRFTSHDNFLDLKLIEQINLYMEGSLEKNIWKTSYAWQDIVRRASPPIAILPLPDVFNDAIREQLKTISLTWNDDDPPIRSMYYLGAPGSYVAWHDDSCYEFASIIFLNEGWNPNWGGLHFYEDLNGLGLRAEVPVFNRCLINAGGVPHGASITSPDAPPRRVIITFGPRAKAKKELAPRQEAWIKWRNGRNCTMSYIEDKALGRLAKAAQEYIIK